MKVWCNLKRSKNIHTCTFHELQVFKWSMTTPKSCHSKPNTHPQFEKNNHVSAIISSQECVLFDPARTLTPRLSFLAAQLVGLWLRALWSKYERLIREHANQMFFEIWQKYLPTLKTSPSVLLTHPFPILAYLRCSHLFGIITNLSSFPLPPQFKNFAWVANTSLLIRTSCNKKTESKCFCQSYINFYIMGFHTSGKLFQYFIDVAFLIPICKKTSCTFFNKYKRVEKYFYDYLVREWQYKYTYAINQYQSQQEWFGL